MSETKGLKLEAGMMLVYTPDHKLSCDAATHAKEILDTEARKALAIDQYAPLPIGIVLLSPGDTLELLKAKDTLAQKTENRANQDNAATEIAGSVELLFNQVKRLSEE